MLLRIPYGQREMEAELGGLRVLGTIDVADAPALGNPGAALREAVAAPIGLDRPLCAAMVPGHTVTLVVSDSFRKTRIEQVLPALLDELGRAGIRDRDIRVVFATGTHRGPTEEEQVGILGAGPFERLRGRLFTHDPDDPAGLVQVGTTSRGTPVEVNRLACETDYLLLTGTVVLHYFGGFGGGRKSLVPGLASRRAIAHNHAMNLDPVHDRRNPAVRIGVMDGNPVAEDMFEAASFVTVTGIVNTVLNRSGAIAGLFVGALDAAHRAATAFAGNLYLQPIAEPADLVIASAGPARNFVQSHKALYNAYQAVKPGGRIIFLVECPEGLGGEQFVKWLRLGNAPAIIRGLRQQAEINGQTALSTIEKGPMTVFVTAMTEGDAALLGGRKAPDLQAAVDLVRGELPANPTCYLMPNASYSVPFLL